MTPATALEPDDLTDLIRTLLGELRALRQDLARLRAASGPRDGADVHLLVTLAAECGGRTFTAADLWRHAHVAPDLSAAFLGADLTSAVEVGHWLTRMRGVPAAGLTVTRGRRGSTGRTWRVEPV